MIPITYKFKGIGWWELAKCWNIKVEERPLFVNSDKIKIRKTVEKEIIVNKRVVKFEIEDEDEIIAEKTKRYIWNSIDLFNGKFKDQKIRKDIHKFLEALIGNDGHEKPVYEGLLKVEDDYTLAAWICHNLERF